MDPPVTQNSLSMPRWSISSFWARTMSAMVMTGKSSAQASPVAGFADFGPVVPMQPPSTLTQMTKKRSVSRARPGPTIWLHQPGLPVTGWVPARNWSPVRAWQTRMAFDLSALSRP